MAILPDRPELTTPADGDLYVTTDVSDTTDAATGTDKKITWASIKTALSSVFAPALGTDDNYVTDAEKAALHAAVTVADSSEIDFTLTGQQISAAIVAGSIDETKLDTSVNASLDLADSAVQPAGLSGYFQTANIDDTPVNGETSAPISSNWAYDHAATAASDSAAGHVELATTAETTTGTDTERAVTPAGAAATYLPILLDATPNSDHTANGAQTSTLAAGATIAIGECVYLGSGGKWLKADNDATASTDKMLAIALEAKNDTEAMKVALPGTFVRDDSWNWTVGAAIYLSNTAGALTETKPTKATDRVVRVVGYAVSADVMWFMPETGVTYA